ncbi:hypothetical protein KAX29_03035 [candidate division WOR-3 bacterium]|nr:hypothetical protein [candidate division WOR-3 bacterium]
MKKVLLVFMVLIILTPTISIAQTSEIGDACDQAKRDANEDANRVLWYGGGCLFGIFAVGAAYVIEPSPPATRLIGKSSEYVAVYTDCYIAKKKSIRGMSALGGCALFLAIYSLVLLL